MGWIGQNRIFGRAKQEERRLSRTILGSDRAEERSMAPKYNLNQSKSPKVNYLETQSKKIDFLFF